MLAAATWGCQHSCAAVLCAAGAVRSAGAGCWLLEVGGVSARPCTNNQGWSAVKGGLHQMLLACSKGGAVGGKQPLGCCSFVMGMQWWGSSQKVDAESQAGMVGL